MTLANELKELLALLDEFGIQNRTQLKKKLTHKDEQSQTIVTGVVRTNSPMEHLQRYLSDLIGEIHRELNPAKSEKDITTMGDTRFWLEREANVWRYNRNSIDEKYREDCLKLINHAKQILDRKTISASI